MNQRTEIAAIVLATILAASIVTMALPLESAEAIGETRGGDARSRGGDADVDAEGGDARQGDFESDGDGNEGNLAEGGIITSGATGGAGGEARGGDASSTYIVSINNS
jgi:hypothetical protein